VPKIAKLKSVVETREAKKQTLETIPERLNQLSETAYPGMMALAEEDPEAIEAHFVAETNDVLNAQDLKQNAGSMKAYYKESLGSGARQVNTTSVKTKTLAKE